MMRIIFLIIGWDMSINFPFHLFSLMNVEPVTGNWLIILKVFFLYYILVFISGVLLGMSAILWYKWNSEKELKKEAILKNKEQTKTDNDLKKFSIVTSKTSNAIFIFNSKGQIEWINKACEDLYGYSLDEFIHQRGNNIYDVSNSNNIRELVDNCIKTKKNIIYETKLITGNGESRYIQTTLSPIINDANEVDKLVAIDSDITQLKKAEYEIAKKNEEIIAKNEELEKHKNKLEELVKQRTNELEIAKNRAEESDRLKSAFLANISHEIRTPMNAIIGLLHILNDRDLSSKAKTDITNMITNSSNILLRLISDLLDVAKIESGQLAIDKKACNVNNICYTLFNMYKANNKVKSKEHIDIRMNLGAVNKELIICSDSVRLQQVLTNLIDNALKFTERGYIEFGYEIIDKNKKPDIKFFVKDTGIGIPPDQKEQIFSRFYKRGMDDGNYYHGTGLGLFICESIVKLLDGEIWVESEENKGSTFYFTLPFIQIKNSHITHKQKNEHTKHI